MTSSLLWFSVVLMVAAILLKKDNKISEMICGAGWLMFGFYWVTLIPSFYTKGDYTNIILTLLLFAFCLLIASFAARAFKSEARREKAKSAEATVWTPK